MCFGGNVRVLGIGACPLIVYKIPIATMTDPEDSDGSDEWGMEEVVIPSNILDSKSEIQDEAADNDDEDYWKVEQMKPVTTASTPKLSDKSQQPSAEPMIIVDITQLEPAIHSRFDKYSVNDSTAASNFRKKIESDYALYSKDANLISEGAIIPCGSSVWRDALVRLREDRPGHYFVPIFPPKR